MEPFRLACLFIVNRALWEYRLQPEKTQSYLAWLSDMMVRTRLDREYSVSRLVWAFLYGDPDDEGNFGGKRLFLVSRLVMVAKIVRERRGGELWDRVMKTLVGFLYEGDEGESVAGGVEWGFDEDEMRWEIWAEVYSGRVPVVA
jgi:hypothetical protein